jgi:membrane-bound lytic murein transglycosylase MltF
MPLLLLSSLTPALAKDKPVIAPPINPQQWTGDLDEIRKQGVLRVLVAHSMTHYFLDGATPRGITYELVREFHQGLSKQTKRGEPPLRLLVIPVDRDELIPWLVEGKGDIAAANLTITPEREKEVDFSNPFITDVKEVVVTGPKSPTIETVDDLSGKTIYVRKSSSYYQSLGELNESFKKRRKKPIKLKPIDEYLEDEDLLEMVNAGTIPMIVVDDHKAALWEQVFDDITVHHDIAVRTGGRIAWAMRKKSPKLAGAINGFVKNHKKGTLLGNILFKRYLRENKWVKNNLAEKELEKLEPMIVLFDKYGEKYRLDWQLLAAQGYQESGLNQKKRSPVGAIGVMQIRPSTAADKNVNVKDIHKLENNIHAGSKYMRFLHDRYFVDQDMDELNRVLFSLAAYNAGPARIRKLQRRAAENGRNPNVWFDHVEIEAARDIGRETVQYVANIYKYYIAYQLAWEREQRRAAGAR